MKKLLLSAALLALAALSARACSYGAPLSYFSGDVGSLQETELGELWLVGRHFFPEWTGTAPRGNDIASAEAHAMDFATAAARAGATDPAGDFARYRECADRWLRAVDERDERLPPFVPVDAEERAAWPDWARQFYLYSLGRAQLLADSSLSAPPAWEELLALPEADRRERTVWVLHGKVLAAKDFAAADEQLRALRAACDAGFTDTCGLEAAVLRRLLLRDASLGLRWLPLVLAAYGGKPDGPGEQPFDVHWMMTTPHGARHVDGLSEREVALLDRAADEFSVWRRPSHLAKDWRLFHALAADPVGREILFVLDGCADDPVPPEAEPATPLLSADRAAFRAFSRGEYVTARALLRYAPDDSLLRLFLEARLARMDGDLPLAAEKLRRWLAVYREKGDGEWCDFAILNPDRWDEQWGDGNSVPWPRYVAGILGLVEVEREDFAEALGVFVRDADSWLDAAFVAERCLSAAELAACLPELEESMAASGEGMVHAGKLEGLLARRLMRMEKPADAGEWFARAAEESKKAFDALPEERKAPCWIWGETWRRAEKNLLLWQARQKTAKRAYAAPEPDRRAAAFLDLARLERAAGMELYATELEPDVGIERGTYEASDFPLGESGTARRAEVAPYLPEENFPRTRWHWRARAAKTARRAAAMAESEGVKAAALLLAGGFLFADGQAANEAYQMLSDLPAHPAGKYARERHWIPNWGCGPVADLIDLDLARSPKDWLAGGWESTPEGLAALAEAAAVPTGESAAARWQRRRYGCTLEELFAAGPEEEAEGAEGAASVPPESGEAGEPISYTVQPGDTVASIASVFVISQGALRAANGWDADAEVSPGQRIVVPPAANP